MKVAPDVLGVLDRAEIDGSTLRITDGQLDRRLYEAVNRVLTAAGGKWNRKAKAHLFERDPADAVDQIILTGQVIDERQEYGYFPTPPDIVEQMIGLAVLAPGDEVLEPSAGRGAIASQIPAEGAVVDCIEMLPENAAVITAAGYARKVIVGDFLAIEPTSAYDRVVMNPPFAKQADIIHVRHALQFLRPDGLLVAIMSAGVLFRQNAQSFRDEVYDRGGDIMDLPDGSFKESGTGVRTVLVTMCAGRGEWAS